MEKQKSVVLSVFNFLGGMGGLLSIALLVWKGGALMQEVDDHDRRITAVENGGSPGLREHVKQDDERVSEIRTRIADQAIRITQQQETLSKVSDLAGEVKVINVKLDALKEQLSGRVK